MGFETQRLRDSSLKISDESHESFRAPPGRSQRHHEAPEITPPQRPQHEVYRRALALLKR